jgi:fatty-acid desaturase
MAIVQGYFMSYGLFSQTFYKPFFYAKFLTMHMVNHPNQRSEVCFKILFGVIPVAILLCSMANLSSHRYFSHKSFKTSRVFRAVLALVASASGQRGALWWASHHRLHHRHCGKKGDIHSAKGRGGGILNQGYAQVGWVIDRKNFSIKFEEVKEFCTTEILIIEALGSFVGVGFVMALEKPFGKVAALFGMFMSVHFEGLINSWTHTGKHTGEASACDSFDCLVTAFLTGGEGFLTVITKIHSKHVMDGDGLDLSGTSISCTIPSASWSSSD